MGASVHLTEKVLLEHRRIHYLLESLISKGAAQS